MAGRVELLISTNFAKNSKVTPKTKESPKLAIGLAYRHPWFFQKRSKIITDQRKSETRDHLMQGNIEPSDLSKREVRCSLTREIPRLARVLCNWLSVRVIRSLTICVLDCIQVEYGP